MISRTLGTSSRKFARLRDQFPDVGLFAQALFPLIVASSDDFGRMQGDAFTVKHSVWSTAPDAESVFEAALEAMADVQLIYRYRVKGEQFLEVIDFEAHQVGLHKRTESRFPGPSGKFPEIPGDSLLREQKGTEQKGTEQKGTAPPLKPRPKTFGRITLHRFQIDELINTLGPNAADFGLDEWIDGLSAKADRDFAVLPKEDVWAWVQGELKAECQRRGMKIASAPASGKAPSRSDKLTAMLARVAALDAKGDQ